MSVDDFMNDFMGGKSDAPVDGNAELVADLSDEEKKDIEDLSIILLRDAVKYMTNSDDPTAGLTHRRALILAFIFTELANFTTKRIRNTLRKRPE